ncbi:MAG TPA: class I SAM-dependent methyltransferase [Eubacteriales bacterium]|nr:class I SAM-dependent methyltransferase [Eubacteriales bacterium]
MKTKPQAYADSTAPFWNDEHISKGMLAAHLNPDIDAASRKHDFISNSAEWIAKMRTQSENKLLDLGCGPGLYAEKFFSMGFDVTGIDFSKRSIEYATKNSSDKNHNIKYICGDYLDINYENEFDFCTLIYCDFGVLSPEKRAKLLSKIFNALKKDGKLILDGFTKNQIRNFTEKRSIEYTESGFWRSMPHIVIESDYLYPETDNYLEQYIVATQNECECYNIWNQIFSEQTLGKELLSGGFSNIVFYGDVCGKPFSVESETICAVAEKE